MNTDVQEGYGQFNLLCSSSSNEALCVGVCAEFGLHSLLFCLGFLDSNRMSDGLCRVLHTGSGGTSGLLLFWFSDPSLPAVADISRQSVTLSVSGQIS